MYNTYFSSAVFTLRTKGPLSFSFNDHSNLLCERFGANPPSSQCCSCCNCCSSSFPSNRLLINPTLFYGWRQSTLIQLSPCKRRIFAARDPYSYRVPDCGLDRNYHDVCCEKSGRERIERRRQNGIGRLKLHQRRCLSSADDAEAVISFLSEEVSEEYYLGDRDRNRSLRKRVEIEKRSNYNGDCNGAKKTNKRLSGFELAESNKGSHRREEELEERRTREDAKAIKRKEEWKEKKERGENHRERKPSSSSSSYYSLSSVEDFRSDKEAHHENVGSLEASSTREDNFEEEVETSTKRADSDWELRKKTEKKLTETEETQSQRESLRSHSRIATESGNDYGKVFSSDKLVGDENVGRKQYNRKGDEDLKVGAEFVETVNTSTEMGITRNNQQRSQTSETGNAVKRDNKLQSLSESRMKIREEDVVLRSSWEAREKRQQAFKQITDRIESRSASKHLSERVSDKDSRKTSFSQSQTGMKNQEGSASFVSQSVEETKEQRSHAEENVTQRFQSGNSSQDVTNVAVNVTNVAITHSTDVKTVNYTVNPIQEARERDNQLNKSIAGVKSRDETHKATEISYFEEQNSGKAATSSRPTMKPPSRQMADRGSFRVDPVSGIVIQEVPAESSQSSSSGIYTYGEPLNTVSADDAMISAQRLEESSNEFVGEYIDVAWNEALATAISDSKQLSSAKGPSVEMWDVTEPSLVQESPKLEAPKDKESSSITNTVVRKSGKSLWGIISDVVRFRWASHAETPKSAKRSGGKSSSNDSATSEAWFSGHDPEESSDKNREKERKTPKEATFSVIRQIEPSAASPSTTYISGSTSKGVSSPVEEENLEWGQGRKSFEGTQSLDGKSSLVSLPSRDSGELPVLPLPSSSTSTLVGGAMEIKELPLIAKPIEVLGSEGKDVELKQRKLQRNKQVVKDKFDEWEEAYTHESEQRRIDEMFMREALVEAKKAADTWEVPVGAVLVQHGKIIARGYNLVEELRDSTAHAEMICIREASNQLRSWRLAESTLYVTLEPCAMCAGAILQARIDTLVWGAPNKLLGADGSWIRLFPSSEGGGDKPVAPPHPFHPKMTIRRGILESECADAMQQFFQLRRRKKVKDEENSPPQPSLPIATHQSKFLRKMHDVFHAFLCL